MREKREFKIEGWTLVAMYLTAGAVIAFLGSIAGAVNAWLKDQSHLSGWVQAFGSIAAILGAVWVSQSQQRQAARAAENAARRAARAFAKTIRLTALNVTTSLWEGDARANRIVLEQCAENFFAIDISALSDEWVSALLALRSLAVQIAQHVRTFENTPNRQPVDPRQIGVKLIIHHDMLKHWMMDLQPLVDRNAEIIERD